MKELLEHFGFAMPFVYAAAAYGVFVWLDNETSDQAKAALASTMRLKDYDGKRIASALVEVFDRLYTVPLLHWRAMSRSALFTIIITAVFAFEMRNRFFRLGSTAAAWEFYAGSLATNLVSDYVSLFLIRPCLRKCGSRPVIALVLGTFLGIFVVVLGLLIRAALSIAMMQQCAPGGIPFAITDANLETRGKAIGCVITVSDFVELSSFPAMAVFVWLPLFALGILVARALTPLSSIVTRVQWALKEGDKHPLKLSDASLAWPYLSSAPGGKRCSKRSAEPIS